MGTSSTAGPGGSPNVSAWYRLTDEAFGADVAIAEAGVTHWDDLSSNNYDINDQGTASLRPTNRLNAINGHPAGDFDGSDDQLSLPSGGTFWNVIDATGVGSILAVFRADTASSTVTV